MSCLLDAVAFAEVEAEQKWVDVGVAVSAAGATWYGVADAWFEVASTHAAMSAVCGGAFFNDQVDRAAAHGASLTYAYFQYIKG